MASMATLAPKDTGIIRQNPKSSNKLPQLKEEVREARLEKPESNDKTQIDISEIAKKYLGRIFSTEDEQTIFNGKKINLNALAELVTNLKTNPDLAHTLLHGINEMNFSNHQVPTNVLDSIVENLANYDTKKIISQMQDLISRYAQGNKITFPTKELKSIEALLTLASDANFSENLFRQIKALQPETIKGTDLIEQAKLEDEKEPEDIHAEDVNSIDPNTAWGKVRAYFHDSPPWFQAFRDNFTMVLNYIGIAFNTLAVVATNSNFFSKKVAESIDKKSEWYSRYVIPFSFGWNGVEALVGNRLVEALTRIVPAVSFWALPFYNFNTATGISSGVNYMLELVTNRLKKQNVKIPSHNMLENTKVIGGELLKLCKDFLTNAKTDETWVHKLTSLFLIGGSAGGFLFASNDRDTWSARLFGNMRNIGGFTGDYDLVTNRKYDIHKKVVGWSCGVASILNMIMRWVNPELARTLNHISIAADDFGLTYWAQDSRRHNKTSAKSISTESNSRSLLKKLAA